MVCSEFSGDDILSPWVKLDLLNIGPQNEELVNVVVVITLSSRARSAIQALSLTALLVICPYFLI
jgi:hypothetical protein